VNIHDDPEGVDLLVWAFSRVVFVFVVGIDLKALSERKNGARIERCATPLMVFAVVKELSAHVRTQMIGVDSKSTFNRRSIAVAPGQLTAREVEFSSIAIGN
jgi:hypothetical protein